MNIFAATSNDEFLKSMLSNPKLPKNLKMNPSIHTPYDNLKEMKYDTRPINEIPGANYALEEIAYSYPNSFSNRKKI